jgi:hypothetical protein
MKKLAIAGLISLMIASITGCSDAEIASSNLKKAADSFEINRRIVFYNTMNGEYMLVVEGLCSIGSASETKAVAVTCKTGPNEFKKSFLGLSENVTYFAEQIEPSKVSQYHYKVIFKPASIVPDVEVRK